MNRKKEWKRIDVIGKIEGKNGREKMEGKEWKRKNGRERMEENEWKRKNGREIMEEKEW